MRFRSAVLFACAAPAAFAAPHPAELKVTLRGLLLDGRISPKYAFCALDPNGKSVDGGNMSPELAWEGAPEGTRSYALIMHDADVPSVFDDANKEGKTLPASLPRRDFVHWVLVDIAPTVSRLPEGADSDSVNTKGKRSQQTKYARRGLNDYGSFMPGTFFGYDGPCPPWNDERLHRYTFQVYALDVPTLPVKGAFSAKDVRTAMEGHILAAGSAEGTYTQNIALIESRKAARN